MGGHRAVFDPSRAALFGDCNDRVAKGECQSDPYPPRPVASNDFSVIPAGLEYAHAYLLTRSRPDRNIRPSTRTASSTDRLSQLDSMWLDPVDNNRGRLEDRVPRFPKTPPANRSDLCRLRPIGAGDPIWDSPQCFNTPIMTIMPTCG